MSPSIFSRIIDGEIPGRIIWSDPLCVAMVDIRPLHRGHCLVIPRVEVDHWIDLDADLVQHLTAVAHSIGSAQQTVFNPARIGLMIAGFEVPHTHLHVVPIDSMHNLDFSTASPGDPDDLDEVARLLRAELHELDFSKPGFTDT